MGVRELPKQFSDEHLASEIGKLYVDGVITLIEYEAGVKYGKIVLDYLKTIDAPSPYSNERCESFSDETCLNRKIAMASVRAVIRDLNNPDCARVVDRVAVYGEPIYSADVVPLRLALRALSGN